MPLSDTAAERMRVALDLYEVGERMLQRLPCERPRATPEEIDAEIGEWLRRRPDAENGDYPGLRSVRTRVIASESPPLAIWWS